MTTTKKAIFITFEGGEGNGKTTQSKMLVERLNRENIPAIWTREIGGTDLAEKIRAQILESEALPMSELLMIMAARYDHVHKLILPALNEGKVVVCDRFIESTAAYQGQKTSIEQIYDMHMDIIELLPDITFYMSLDNKISGQRTSARGDMNRYDAMNTEFHDRVSAIFTNLANKFSNRIVTIDASQSIDTIHTQIYQKIKI